MFGSFWHKGVGGCKSDTECQGPPIPSRYCRLHQCLPGEALEHFYASPAAEGRSLSSSAFCQLFPLTRARSKSKTTSFLSAPVWVSLMLETSSRLQTKLGTGHLLWVSPRPRADCLGRDRLSCYLHRPRRYLRITRMYHEVLSLTYLGTSSQSFPNLSFFSWSLLRGCSKASLLWQLEMLFPFPKLTGTHC